MGTLTEWLLNPKCNAFLNIQVISTTYLLNRSRPAPSKLGAKLDTPELPLSHVSGDLVTQILAHCLSLGPTSHLYQHLGTPVINTSNRDIMSTYVLIKTIVHQEHNMEKITRKRMVFVSLESEYSLCFYEKKHFCIQCLYSEILKGDWRNYIDSIFGASILIVQY